MNGWVMPPRRSQPQAPATAHIGGRMRVRHAVLSTLGALALVGGVLAGIPAAAAAAPAAPTVTFVHACAKPAARQMACDALRRTNVTQPAGMSANAVTPNATPSGYGPSDLASAYKYSTSGGVG